MLSDRFIYVLIIVLLGITGAFGIIAGAMTGTPHNLVIGIVCLALAKVIHSNTQELWQKN